MSADDILSAAARVEGAYIRVRVERLIVTERSHTSDEVAILRLMGANEEGVATMDAMYKTGRLGSLRSLRSAIRDLERANLIERHWPPRGRDIFYRLTRLGRQHATAIEDLLEGTEEV